MGALRREAAYPPCCEAGVVFVMTCDFPSFESKSTCKMYNSNIKKKKILIVSESSEIMLHFCPCEMLLHLQFFFKQKFTKLVILCPSVV